MKQRSICDTCAKRTRHIVFTGISTVSWDGNYVCGIYSEEILEPKRECGRYTPRNRGQMRLEAFA